jgi:predicted RecB family nuclease
MTVAKGTLKTCANGHKYYKRSDCPTCPTCEAFRKPATSFLSELVAPARRALEAKGITTLAKLAKHTETEILELHGMGPRSIPKLSKALNAQGLSFKLPPSSMAN